MRIHLYHRLKRKIHRKIAAVQDVIVEELYSRFPMAVLHGGTAIWRCYSGNRFSEDLDVYLEKDPKKLEEFFTGIERRGMKVLKHRVKERAFYSSFEMERVQVRLEGTFRRVKGILKEYETLDGRLLSVYTLGPEALVEEKAKAYLARRKVRDLYDVFFLLRFVRKNAQSRKVVRELLQRFRTPVDEKELQTVLLTGAVPTVQAMREYLERWVS